MNQRLPASVYYECKHTPRHRIAQTKLFILTYMFVIASLPRFCLFAFHATGSRRVRDGSKSGVLTYRNATSPLFKSSDCIISRAIKKGGGGREDIYSRYVVYLSFIYVYWKSVFDATGHMAGTKGPLTIFIYLFCVFFSFLSILFRVCIY